MPTLRGCNPDLSVPTDIVFLVVLWRLRYPLSLRHLAEMFLERGFVFSHETVRAWEALVAPLLTGHLRTRRRGKAGINARLRQLRLGGALLLGPR